jgi:N-acetylglucosamine kinase-like BadF-type ATPase
MVLGADGGGTKTLGVLADASGKELARRQVGPGNPNVAGVDGAAANIVDLLAGCCDAAHRDPADLGAVVLGLAGAGSAPIRERLAARIREILRERNLPEPVMQIETDARIALEGAFGGQPGAIVIAGTGSVVLGKGADGNTLMIGGWGRVMGDEGSGYFIGVETLKRIAREMDGRSPESLLRAMAGERHGWTTRERLITAVYQEKFEIPSLAPMVMEAAGRGDEAALRILRHGAELLTEQVASFASTLPPGAPVGIVFIGGLIAGGTVYAGLFTETLRRSIPRVEVRSPQFPPAEGAVLMAVQRLSGR